MPFYSARNLCPNCAKPICGDTLGCGYCGTAIKGRNSSRPWRLPEGVAWHRGERIVKLAVFGGLLCFVGGLVFGCAGYYRATPGGLLLQVCGLSILAVGQTCGIVAAVLAYRDLLGMKMGRVDRAGWWPTMFGGLLAVFSVLLSWLMIGFALHSLF